MQTTDYETQAQDFLAKHGIKLTVKATDSGKCPPFCDDSKHIHGNEHRVTLTQGAKRLSFPFWNSQHDMKTGKSPTVYDVLSCVGSDLTCPETFEDFCAEYGYDKDSRKAERQFKGCASFGKQLRAFFDDEQMQTELQSIN